MVPTLTWERVAHHSHLYVLPAAGVAASILGVVGLIGARMEPTALLPTALVLVGTSAIVGSVGSYMCLPKTEVAPVRAPGSHTKNAEPEAVNAVTGRAEPSREKVFEPRPGRAHVSIGRATLAELTQIEDEIWKRWARPQTAALGAELVGPVPETAFSPHKAGAFVAFPDKDEDAVPMEVDAKGIAAARPQEARRSPASARTIDSAGRSLQQAVRPARREFGAPTGATARTPVLLPVNVPIGPSAKSNPTGRVSTVRPRSRMELDSPEDMLPVGGGLVSPLAAGRVGALSNLDAFDHPAYFESAAPTPPRPSGPSDLRPGHTAHGHTGTRSPSVGRRICTECSRHLVEFRTWVECRACRKPLCQECLEESFHGRAPGTCSECGRNERWSPQARRSPSPQGRPVTA